MSKHSFSNKHEGGLGLEDEALTSARSYRSINGKMYFVACWSMFATIGYAFSLQVTSSTLGQVTFTEYFNFATRKNLNALISAIVSVWFAGGFFGIFLQAWISRRYGRKVSVVAGNTIMILGAVICAASVNVGMIIAGRIITGFASFMLLISSMTYLSEVSSAETRGFISGLVAWGASWGLASSAWVGYGESFAKTSGAWRILLALQAFFPLLTLVGGLFVPESPRWLALQGRDAEALAVLKELRRNVRDPEDIYARREMIEISRQCVIDTKLPSTYFSMFTKRSYRKRTLVGMGTFFISQVNGVLVINNFAPTIYAQLGFNSTSQLALNAGAVTCGVLGNLIGIAVIDRIGRVWLIVIGSLATACVLAAEAGITAVYVGGTNLAGLRSGAACLFLFQTVYTSFLEPALYVYTAEIFPNHLREKGLVLCIATQIIVDVSLISAAPYAFASIGYKFYIVFVAFATAGALVAFLIFPETKNIPLEEVAAKFNDDEVAVYARDIHLGDDHEVHVDSTARKEGLN